MEPEDTAPEGMEVGVCADCGDDCHYIFTDNKRCEDCDGNFYFCDICKEEQHVDNSCRHVFRGRDDYEWKGSGAWADPDLKEPLFRLFGLMPDGFAEALRTAIESGNFYTFLTAPLIGSGGMLEMHGMPDRDGTHSVIWWGDHLIKVGESEDAEATADAYNWLASLYKTETPEANQTTIQWIEDYLRARGEREQCQPR